MNTLGTFGCTSHATVIRVYVCVYLYAKRPRRQQQTARAKGPTERTKTSVRLLRASGPMWRA